MIDSSVPAVNLKSIGLHLSRPKSQHGWLTEQMPKRGKLPRGRWFGRWRVYFRAADGTEKSKKAEKIIDRPLAEKMGFTLSYDGPLTKTDARKVLEELIRESNLAPTAFNSKTTFGDLAREYIAMRKPGWDADTARVNEQLIETHLIGKLGERPVRELADVEMQDFMNGYVEAGSSKSLLAKLVMFLRAILKRAVKKQLIKSNPAEDVKARSRKKAAACAILLRNAPTCTGLCLAATISRFAS